MRAIIVLLFLAQIAAAQSPPTSPPVAAGSKQVGAQPEGQPKAEDLTSLPLGKGLPVLVRTGLYFHSIDAFDDNAGLYTGTVDMRLRWDDSRLSYPAETTPRGFQEFRGPKADEKLKEVWAPG